MAIVDINKDSWSDVCLTSAAGKDPENRKNRLWINEGSRNGEDPVFKEMADAYGIADKGHSITVAFFDYDLDA